jgi:SAM-dependent methyltransferase
MRDLVALSRFYLDARSCGESLLDIWERGEAWGDSVTPTTYVPRYRAWMLAKLERCLAAAGDDRVLAVGCGNAVIESELERRGHHVLAIDVLPRAVELARSKGVNAIVADAATWEPPHRRWDLLYADGLLGHLYEDKEEAIMILERFHGWLKPRTGVLIVSNDAPTGAGDVVAAAGVKGFHWLSMAFIARQLERAGYSVCESEEFPYDRPLSGTRHRAVVTARAEAGVKMVRL